MTMNDDLDPFEQNGLEGGRPGNPVEPVRSPPLSLGEFARLARKRRVLVVQSDDADRAQDRLAQPAQAEEQQQDADDDLQRPDRNGVR